MGVISLTTASIATMKTDLGWVELIGAVDTFPHDLHIGWVFAICLSNMILYLVVRHL